MTMRPTTAFAVVLLALAVSAGCGRTSLPVGGASASPVNGDDGNAVPMLPRPPTGSACTLLSVGTMQALLGSARLETYHVELPVDSGGSRVRQCSFQPNPNYPPGFISFSCGPISASTYADWVSPGKGSLLIGSDPAPMYGVNGSLSHGFTYKKAASPANGCLIEIAGFGSPADGALTRALGEAYRNSDGYP